MTEEQGQPIASEALPAPVEAQLEKPVEAAQKAEKPLSLKQTIEKNFKEVEDREKGDKPDAKPKEKTTAQRDKDAQKPAENQAKPQTTQEMDPEKPQGPPKQVRWRQEAAAHWDKLPDVVRREILMREEEAHRKITSNDEERDFGRQLREVIQPYMPLITSEGSDPRKAVTNLLNTAYKLRNSSPEEKGILLWQLANQYGANMRVDPKVLQQRIAQPAQQPRPQPAIDVGQIVEQKMQQAELQRNIEAFKSDPKNKYFEKLRPAMATLLKSEQALTLQEAYDKACWSDNDIRSTLLEEQKATFLAGSSSQEAQRIQQIKEKTKAAKNASASVTGAPGLNGSAVDKKKGLSVRASLERAWNEHVN